MEPAGTLLGESNRLNDSINVYNNTLVAGFNSLLLGYGLVEPLTVEQLNGLTLKQQGAIFQALGPVITAFGREISSRTVEGNLLDGGGYNSIDAAIADVGTHYNGQSKVTIEQNLTQTKAIVTSLDAQMDAAFLLDLLTRIVAVKNAVATAATQMARV